MNVAENHRQESVLVTGGTGFVGRWLVEILRQRGSRVTVLARESGPRPEVLPDNVEVVNGPLQDFRFLSGLFSRQSIDTIFHLAAQPLVAVGRELPMETWETNCRGTWHLLEAMRLSGVRHMVLASSDKVCGHSLNPSAGQTTLTQIDPYSASKICAELVTRTYASAFGLRVAIARFSNLYGGGDLNFSRLVPDVIRSTLNGERVMIRSDGKARVNLLYVKDAAKAFLILAARLKADAALSGRAFNFGMANEISVLDTVDMVLGLMGRQDLKPIVAGVSAERGNTPKFNTVEAHENLGWNPDYSLNDGLTETIGWYRSHFQNPALDTVTKSAMASHGLA
jgi:CDP-glucose 4,6-dehydratase